MSEHQIGDRVAAYMAPTSPCEFLGYGVYEGDFIPPSWVKFRGTHIGIPNPRIRLDDGRVMWGCMCYWTQEEEFNSMVEENEIKLVDKKETCAELFANIEAQNHIGQAAPHADIDHPVLALAFAKLSHEFVQATGTKRSPEDIRDGIIEAAQEGFDDQVALASKKLVETFMKEGVDGAEPPKPEDLQ